MSLPTTLLSKRLPIIALTLCIVAIAGSLLISRSTFNRTAQEIQKQIELHHLTSSQFLASLAAPEHALSDSVLLVQISKMWEREKHRHPDEYICIVDPTATLILHSAAPKTVGNDARGNCLIGSGGGTESTLGELVSAGEAYVGGYISSTGEEQIAAFSPIPNRGWLLGVHRSKSAINDEIASKLNSQYWGVLIISLGIIPLAFGILFFLVLRINRGQKQSALELIRSEQATRAITQTAADAIITINSKGSLLSWNKAAERIFGYSASQMIGSDLSQILPSKYLNAHKEGVKKLSEGGQGAILGKTVELSALNAAGQELPVELSLSSWESDGETHYTGIIRDITERKQAENDRQSLELQLRQAQKLEAIGTMAAGIAHDFNNILQAQFLYTGILERQLSDDDQLHDYLKHIVDSGKRSRDLVRQILTFSRQAEVDFEEVRVQDILMDSLKLIKAAAPSSINIVDSIDGHAAPVMGDPSQIQQVVLNLCNNAIQSFGDLDGEISVSFKEIHTENLSDVSETHFVAARGVELTVKDNGCGMSPNVLKNIFDPFFTTKDADQGSGLGLATTYGIVKEMQGQIDVTSKTGEGSTFRIWLPTIESTGNSESSLLTSSSSASAQRVLFVDDEDAIRESAKTVLENHGLKVFTAASGMVALELMEMENEKFDIIVSDYIMPGISGLDFAARALKLMPDCRIVMMSGNVDRNLLDGCKELGIKRVLQKPWTEDSLLKNILNS